MTQILNRTGHCISYSEIKGLETEFAYSAASNESDAPDGIRLDPNVATACVWDNNDANVLTNGVFKNEFAKFLLKEWKKANYWNIFGGKTLIASYGGECLQYVPTKIMKSL